MPNRAAVPRTARACIPVMITRSTCSGDSSVIFNVSFHAWSTSGAYMISPNRSSHCRERAEPGVRHRSRNSSVALAPPRYSAMTDPSASLPTRTAAAPSPPCASSELVGKPERRSEATTSTLLLASSALRSAPGPERSAPPKSKAPTFASSRSAACIVDALFLSRYAGSAVANHNALGQASECADRSASRAASTPIVVVSSS